MVIYIEFQQHWTSSRETGCRGSLQNVGFTEILKCMTKLGSFGIRVGLIARELYYKAGLICKYIINELIKKKRSPHIEAFEKSRQTKNKPWKNKVASLKIVKFMTFFF